jgi:hypothetical protein
MSSRSHAPPLPAVVLGAPLLLALVLTLFAWPAARMAPHELPLGVVGQAPAALPAGIDVHRYEDAASAETAIREREVYAAIAPGPTLLIATAASPAVAQSLQQSLAPLRPRVVDLVPTPDDDPRGAAFAASLLPLIIAGLAAGIGVSLAVAGGWARAGSLVGVAALAGLAAVAVTQGWLGTLDGDWLTNAGALALVVLAVGAVVAGANALAGYAGVGLTAALMVLIGNPWSGIASAPELLPAAAGAIGSLLPPGAGGTLLRGTAFFDGHGTTGALVVLPAWVAVGFALLALAARRRTPSQTQGATAGGAVRSAPRAGEPAVH